METQNVTKPGALQLKKLQTFSGRYVWTFTNISQAWMQLDWPTSFSRTRRMEKSRHVANRSHQTYAETRSNSKRPQIPSISQTDTEKFQKRLAREKADCNERNNIARKLSYWVNIKFHSERDKLNIVVLSCWKQQ